MPRRRWGWPGARVKDAGSRGFLSPWTLVAGTTTLAAASIFEDFDRFLNFSSKIWNSNLNRFLTDIYEICGFRCYRWGPIFGSDISILGYYPTTKVSYSPLATTGHKEDPIVSSAIDKRVATSAPFYHPSPRQVTVEA
jgi:hypothetical protein